MNSSSMIALKAELYRKKDEFKKEKIASASGSYVKGRIQEKTTKSDLFSKKNKGVLERAQRDYEEKVEEEDVHEKSRRALEAKAKLYDKISSSSDIPEEDGSVMYLVDFQKKVIDKIVEKRRQEDDKGRQPTSDDDVDDLHEEIPAPSDPQEEWVDYVDSLGRSRRCMKKELPQVEKQDKEMAKLRGEPMKTSESEGEAPELMSHDMHREMLRQKWEREEEEALKNTNIHYSNVQFDEIRTHGVGFYQFDKNEETRKEQLDRLKNLRKQTVDERGRREKLKEKRKALLDARLAKVKQRRRMKDGVGMTEGQDEDEIGPKLEDLMSEKKPDAVTVEKKMPEPLIRDDSWKKTAPVREWDKGKDRTAIFSEERYMSERREERLSEFAPPKMYRDTEPNPATIILPREAYKKPKPSATKTQETKPDIENISDIPLPQSFQENVDIKQPDGMQQSYLPLNVPLPDMSKPPPGMQPLEATQWGQHSDLASSGVYANMAATMNAAAQAGFGIPMNLSVPPPGYPCAPDVHQSVQLPMQNMMQDAPGQTPTSVYVPPLNETAGRYESVARAPPAQIQIPRSAIVDTRLVQNEDSDVSAPAPDVSGVEGQSYEPGSFTAAIQVDYVTSEDIAAESRLKSQYKASPVIYKHEEEMPDANEQEVETVDENEDQVAAFLKTLRGSS